MRKKIYFAGHMKIDYNTNEIDLENDYRTCLLNNPKQIIHAFKNPIPLNEKYSYAYPSFYYSDENGNPSIDSNLIIQTETKTLLDTDILVAYLGKTPTAGTLGEIMYASLNGKEVYIYYEPCPTDSKIHNTNQWYVIMMAQHALGDRCHVKQIKDTKSFLNELFVDFQIKAIRYPKEEK